MFKNPIKKIRISLVPIIIFGIFLAVTFEVWEYTTQNTVAPGTQPYVPNLIFLVMSAISVLTFMMLVFLFSSRYNANQKIKIQTSELLKFKKTVEASTDAILITKPDRTIVYANDAYVQLSGYSKGELLGKQPNLLKSAQTPKPEFDRLNDCIVNRETFQSDKFVNRRKDGTFYHASLAVVPVMNSGVVDFYIGLQHDLTELMEIDKAKNEFVSLASHQLKTPLSTINWHSELLLDKASGKLNKDQHENAQEIATASRRITKLVNTLLNVSLIEMGSFAINPTKIKITEVLKGVLKAHEEKIKEKKITLKHTVANDFPALTSDKTLVGLLLDNLISNAVKYTPEGGQIKINITKKNTRNWECTISDTGYGIPAEDQKKIFTKMFRARNANKHEVSGTGLGLYTVKKLLDSFGGHISFVSNKKRGMTFTMTLPIKLKPREGMNRLS